jgi:hypothetical protein
VHPLHPVPPHWAYFATEHPPPPVPPPEVVVAAAEDLEVEVADVRRVVLEAPGTEVAGPESEPGV